MLPLALSVRGRCAAMMGGMSLAVFFFCAGGLMLHYYSNVLLRASVVIGLNKNRCFQKYGLLPPNHQFVHRVFHYFHHPFWDTFIFGLTPKSQRTQITNSNIWLLGPWDEGLILKIQRDPNLRICGFLDYQGVIFHHFPS